MVSNVGIIGLSEGNGHPYSFSAIINGYDQEKFKHVGWPVIHNYLSQKDATEFGVPGLKVNAVWTQDIDQSKKIAQATHIDNVCSSHEEMIDLVDAVIIARDDWETHYPLAMSFLKEGKFVFVDKPLSLDINELRGLKPFLEGGKLMSCAALRYATEFDEFRQLCKESHPTLINATIVSDWERYGVHLLDGVFSGIPFNVESVFSSGSLPRSTILTCQADLQIVLNCLGNAPKTFNLSCYFEDKKVSCNVNDNFTAFKRTLSHFKGMIETSIPPVPPSLTLNLMKTLMAGNLSVKEGRKVYLDEFEI